MGSDPDGDTLGFLWGEFDEGKFHPFGEGVRTGSVFRAEDTYHLGLVVSDGSTSVVTRFTLFVYTQIPTRLTAIESGSRRLGGAV